MARTVLITSDQVAAARALRRLLGEHDTPAAVVKIADAHMPGEVTPARDRRKGAAESG